MDLTRPRPFQAKEICQVMLRQKKGACLVCYRAQGWSLPGGVGRERGTWLGQDGASGCLRGLAPLPAGLRVTHPAHEVNQECQAKLMEWPTAQDSQTSLGHFVSIEQVAQEEPSLLFLLGPPGRGSEWPSHPLQWVKCCCPGHSRLSRVP